jgi:hypothetical protein
MQMAIRDGILMDQNIINAARKLIAAYGAKRLKG